MAKLYLIRKNYEIIEGPFTEKEFSTRFNGLAIGTEDEVSGHLGPWVCLEDRRRLEKYYPKIATIIPVNSVGPWTREAAVQTATRNMPLPQKGKMKEKSSKQTKQKAPPPPQKKKQKPFKMIALLFFLLIGTAGGLWYKFQNKIQLNFGPNSLPTHANIEKAYMQENWPLFEAQMNKLMPQLPSIMKKKKKLDKWLPYLRHYAFIFKSGYIKGVDFKTLKGPEAIYAPLNCSEPFWMKHWEDSVKDWEGFENGNKLPKSNAIWARVLTWDPYWIGRRTFEGWFSPQSFYGACITVAWNTLDKLSKSKKHKRLFKTKRTIMNRFLSRLAWQAAVVNGTEAPDYRNVFNGPLPSSYYWTCLEWVTAVEDLNLCQRSSVNKGSMAQIDRHRKYYSFVRLSVGIDSKLKRDDFKFINDNQASVKTNDPFTRFDYKAEQKFINLLKKRKLAGREIAKELGSIFSTVDFLKN